ncbi:Spy/CpxP family protein refolding chaperone [Piscinibacter sp. XHJ-5]|uniref:Spy/CpxP family protein refolding chaperone n=1 Tax=Piscinibacter sp. XHJ-5 TaxID=3037797 RepID=UPI0024534CA1|nr:Spy/CpxP family protein refolding chaperone [Piscinibacter sp. XHJ-5]
MKPWLKRTFVGLFGASALLGGVAACSHSHYGHGGWQSMGPQDAAKFKARAADKVADKLDLDAAQKAKLTALLDRLHEQRTALHGTTDPRADVQSLMKDATFDRWHAQDLVNAKLNALREKSPQVIAALGDFYDSLRPEQQQRVREFLQRSHRWGHHG